MKHEAVTPAHPPELPFLTEDFIQANIDQYRHLVSEYSPEKLDNLWDKYSNDIREAEELGRQDQVEALKEQISMLDFAENHRKTAERYLGQMELNPEKVLCNDDSLLGRMVRRTIEEADWRLLSRDVHPDAPRPPHAPLQQHFIPFDDVRIRQAINSESQKVTYERMSDQEPLELPTTAFVSADGFDSSWQEGWGNKEKTDKSTGAMVPSQEMIKRYSQMPAETAPPVDEALGFYQPNGMIMYLSRDGHRVAAAIERGDPVVSVKSVTLIPISENLVEAPSEESHPSQ